jgi:sulfur relay protein TusB/DsrH
MVDNKSVLNIFSKGLKYTWLLKALYNNYLIKPGRKKIQDPIILIQDGVYFVSLLKDQNLHLKIYALQIDLEARGLINVYKNHNIELISYERFVELIIKYDKNITW